MKSAILMVDDEPNILAALRRAMVDEPYEIHAASGADEALRLLRTHKIKVVLSDEQMPGMRGAEFLRIVKEKYPDTIRILLTGQASIEATMKAVNDGEIYRFFTKPWNDLELTLALRSAMEKYDLETEIRQLQRVVKGQSKELARLETRHPGITRLETDEKGNVVLPDLSDEDIAEIEELCVKTRE